MVNTALTAPTGQANAPVTQQDLDNALAPIHAQLANTTAQLAKAEQHIARIEWKMSIVSLQKGNHMCRLVIHDFPIMPIPNAAGLVSPPGLAQVTSSSEVDALLGPDLDAWLEFYGLVAPPSVLDKPRMSSPFTPAAKSAASTSTSTANSTPSSPLIAAPEPPPLPALHLAAQTGDLSTLANLLSHIDHSAAASSSGASNPANERDAQGITALHWAAINNHVIACKMLLESGAEVDAVGGDLGATPLQWAARNGHLYVVHLLLKYSADPTLLDSQSFNTLHLAVHSSSALLLAYILFTSQPIAVDSCDTEGHTGLHWACYQGDAISVELLLRAGADPRRADNARLTPLHWAAVKGNAACIKRIVEAGADLSAKEGMGKTARDMAAELKSLAPFKRGLVDAGYDEDGRKERRTLSPLNTNLAIFVVPTLAFALVLNTLAILPWWSGLLLAAAEFFGMHHVISRVLLDVRGPQHSDRITKSPYLCSIIVASMVWVSWVWLTRFARGTPGHAIGNLFCATGILVCAYNFFRAITLDPGHVPAPANDSELKEMIEELVDQQSFNGMNFCLTCMTRRPLRSKHSFATERCTARFDHYCPWVWNDVGVNNHRQFLIFVATLVFALVIFVRLSIAYFTENAPDLPDDASCLIPGPLCVASHYDPFALSVVLWAALQVSWTTILLVAQLWQVCRQMTTLEVSNVGRYGFMGGKPGVSAAAQQGLVERWTTERDAASTASGEEHQHGAGCSHGKKSTKSSFLLKILGIDRFTSGKAAEGLAKAGTVANPFDLGFVKNCYDFWGRGRELGVDYTRLYDVPDGGFRRALRDRKRREKEERELGAVRASAPRPKGGYERVAMDDV